MKRRPKTQKILLGEPCIAKYVNPFSIEDQSWTRREQNMPMLNKLFRELWMIWDLEMTLSKTKKNEIDVDYLRYWNMQNN